MGRAPCCEEMGLKKGPWSKEEDQILISYINQHGHENWRALPKKAGLLRCGKSCRLRWTNYLRPDIKRGNFSKEEEDTIIHLHQVLGNRWSAIAARLPGRTDNEIKNVWHIHLKKRLVKQAIPGQPQNQQKETAKSDHLHVGGEDTKIMSFSTPESTATILCPPNSPLHSSSSSDVSSSITTTATNPDHNNLQSNLNLDQDFWLEAVSCEDSEKFSGGDGLSCFPLSPLHALDCSSSFNTNNHDMVFWSDLFTSAEELLQLPDF